MIKFLIDEDIPRSAAKVLRDRGYEVLDVRDCGLRGEPDEEVFKFAQEEKAVLLTGDLGFGNLLRFPVGKHSGVVIVHFPNEISASKLNNQITKAFDTLTEKDLDRTLMILEPGKIRIRRK
jgi:predicted nuclease of predicted toxin-antitoxin system